MPQIDSKDIYESNGIHTTSSRTLFNYLSLKVRKHVFSKKYNAIDIKAAYNDTAAQLDNFFIYLFACHVRHF